MIRIIILIIIKWGHYCDSKFFFVLVKIGIMTNGVGSKPNGRFVYKLQQMNDVERPILWGLTRQMGSIRTPCLIAYGHHPPGELDLQWDQWTILPNSDYGRIRASAAS